MDALVRSIQVPSWVKTREYMTMTPFKKMLAVKGDLACQEEWMIEEVNEFYEAIENQDIDESLDEAIGLIRTAQQFENAPKVKNLWERVKKDIYVLFQNEKKRFEIAFEEWHKKKIKKGQSLHLKMADLIEWADIKF